jgi:4-amino-4-deoxy-L-arabinose transferase-like glycosyltransferase
VRSERWSWTGDTAILLYIALATLVLHLFSNGRYGFHRDELATLDDARHLAWGYVAYPPVTPFFGHVSLLLFGTSLSGFRFFAAVAQAVALFLIGLMAKELGGRRGAQIVAACAGLPFCIGAGAIMQYVSFDYFFWVLTAYCVVRLLASDDKRWWVAIGASIGLGMMAKFTMGFLVAGIVIGLLATPARKYLKSKWLWYGVAVSLLVYSPNLVWQIRHHFITLDFLKHIHARDVRWGRTNNFLPDQLKMTLLAFPIAIAGLYFYFRGAAGKRFRMLGWMWVVPFVLFIAAKGRGYYMAAGYPILYAAGSVWGEQWLATRKRALAASIRALVYAALALDAALAGVVEMRIFEIGTPQWKWTDKVNDDLREEVGWPELVATVAAVRDALPSDQQSRLAILAGNYGEAGALNLYGPQYHLPPVISGVNSFWARGYPDPHPEILITVGMSKEFLDENFASCRVVAHVTNRYGVSNEETQFHPNIYVCSGLKQSWPDFWKDFQYYG